MKTSNEVGSPVTAVSRPLPWSAGESARAVTDGDIVLASVEVSAPPDRVFRALLSEETERWWGAPGVYTIEAWKAEVRVGGTWSLMVRKPDGHAVPAHGEFLVVEQPSKVVQTRCYDFDYPNLGRRATKVTYQLTASDTGTRLTVRHEDFGHSAPAFEHATGWVAFLDWLSAYLARERRGQAQ